MPETLVHQPENERSSFKKIFTKVKSTLLGKIRLMDRLSNAVDTADPIFLRSWLEKPDQIKIKGKESAAIQSLNDDVNTLLRMQTILEHHEKLFGKENARTRMILQGEIRRLINVANHLGPQTNDDLEDIRQAIGYLLVEQLMPKFNQN